VPVCHNCGREIPAGKKFCEQCGPIGEERLKLLMESSERTRYKPPPRGYNRALIITMLGLAVVLVALSIGIALSIPTGPAYVKKAQAAVCRANMRDIESAIDKYYALNNKYPPKGRVDHGHPIITDQYLKSPPRCPSTNRYYLLVSDGLKTSVECDSGLAGHEL
jgi:Tfp pilus assembly protein PilE